MMASVTVVAVGVGAYYLVLGWAYATITNRLALRRVLRRYDSELRSVLNAMPDGPDLETKRTRLSRKVKRDLQRSYRKFARIWRVGSIVYALIIMLVAVIVAI